MRNNPMLSVPLLAVLLVAGPAPAADVPPSAAARASAPARPAPVTRADVIPASPAGRAALMELIGPLDEPEAADGSASVRAVTAVRPGETLDGIIRRTLGDLPFKESFLRALFVQVNPRAYPNGNVQRLDPGTPLNVPSVADLRAALRRSLGPERAAALRGTSAPEAAGVSRSSAGASPAPGAGTTAASVAVTPALPPKPDYRGWVRFP